MSNKAIAVVVGVVVVLGGAYYAMRGTSTEVPNTNSIAVGEPNPSTPSENASGKKMSFDAFLKQGGSYMCTVSQTVQGIDSKGTVYINGGNVRGDFSTTVSGMNISTMFLTKDGYSYSWSSMMPGKGYKVSVKNPETVNSSQGTSGQYSFNAEQIGDYECNPWTADASKFAMPSGVVFTEVKN